MAALRIDMMTKLANAPRNTVIRGCRVAMIAAIKKVLSPALSVPIDTRHRRQRTDFRNYNHDESVKQSSCSGQLIFFDMTTDSI
jgi:hypothetical protein